MRLSERHCARWRQMREVLSTAAVPERGWLLRVPAADGARSDPRFVRLSDRLLAAGPEMRNTANMSGAASSKRRRRLHLPPADGARSDPRLLRLSSGIGNAEREMRDAGDPLLAAADHERRGQVRKTGGYAEAGEAEAREAEARAGPGAATSATRYRTRKASWNRNSRSGRGPRRRLARRP